MDTGRVRLKQKLIGEVEKTEGLRDDRPPLNVGQAVYRGFCTEGIPNKPGIIVRILKVEVDGGKYGYSNVRYDCDVRWISGESERVSESSLRLFEEILTNNQKALDEAKSQLLKSWKQVAELVESFEDKPIGENEFVYKGFHLPYDENVNVV